MVTLRAAEKSCGGRVASEVGGREVLKSGGLTGESGLRAGDGGWPPGLLAGEAEKC